MRRHVCIGLVLLLWLRPAGAVACRYSEGHFPGWVERSGADSGVLPFENASHCESARVRYRLQRTCHVGMPTEITTERLVLRPFRAEDVADALAYRDDV